MAEAPVADEVDDDVVAEARAVGEREPDRRDRRLGIVGVDVDDRRVEALGEVGGVAGRAALRRVGREADLVVRDHVQRAAGRVALERVEVERLGDDPLPGERRVAVEEDRHRDARDRGPRPASERSVCSARVIPSTTGSTASRWLGFAASVTAIVAARGRADALGAEVVLDVAGPALGVGGDDLDRPLALELAEDLLVGQADRVGEDVEPAAVGHPDHDLARAGAAASSSDSSSIGISTSSPSSENCFWPRKARRR